jgi:hypothetical protein
LREQPLFERKKRLRKLVRRSAHTLLYVDYVASGTDLFRVICDRDMEGIVAKQSKRSTLLRMHPYYKPRCKNVTKQKHQSSRRAPSDDRGHRQRRKPLIDAGRLPLTKGRCRTVRRAQGPSAQAVPSALQTAASVSSFLRVVAAA